jgi:hypothetical protein
MDSTIPSPFGEAFLDWFQQNTELAWATYPTPTLQHFAELGRGGCDWKPGTRWLGGLQEEHVAEIERMWDLPFPPDYRLFLLRLHAVDHPWRCIGRSETLPGEPSQPTLHDEPAFSNWLTDADRLRARLDRLAMGFACDVVVHDWWRPSWGIRPATSKGREEHVRQLVVTAPRLIPIFANRYLLAQPCTAGNPVLAIVPPDIEVYAADLRNYFLLECADLLGIDRAKVREDATARMQARCAEYTAIPFWGDLLAP